MFVHFSKPTDTITSSTLLSNNKFLALGFVCPLATFLLPATILVQIGTALGDTTNIVWLAGGWSVASSVSFSIAGSLSDIFGRRYVTLTGQALSIIGAVRMKWIPFSRKLRFSQVVGGTAKTTSVVVAGSTILGFACGIVFVAYAGIPELLPNKWR